MLLFGVFGLIPGCLGCFGCQDDLGVLGSLWGWRDPSRGVWGCFGVPESFLGNRDQSWCFQISFGMSGSVWGS